MAHHRNVHRARRQADPPAAPLGQNRDVSRACSCANADRQRHGHFFDARRNILYFARRGARIAAPEPRDVGVLRLLVQFLCCRDPVLRVSAICRVIGFLVPVRLHQCGFTGGAGFIFAALSRRAALEKRAYRGTARPILYCSAAGHLRLCVNRCGLSSTRRRGNSYRQRAQRALLRAVRRRDRRLTRALRNGGLGTTQPSAMDCRRICDSVSTLLNHHRPRKRVRHISGDLGIQLRGSLVFIGSNRTRLHGSQTPPVRHPACCEPGRSCTAYSRP